MLPVHDAQARIATPLTAGERGTGLPAIPVRLPHTFGGADARRVDIVWSDVDAAQKWAKTAINYVGATNAWMRDFAPNPDGTYPFQPATARDTQVLRAGRRPGAGPDGADRSLDHVPRPRPERRLLPRGERRREAPLDEEDAVGDVRARATVTTTMVHRVLVLALGLGSGGEGPEPPPHGDGTTFQLPQNFGTLVLGMRLGLRYNSSDESADVGPKTPLTRAQVAYSLYRAMTQPTWNVPELLAEYSGIELPALTPAQQQIVQWGVRYVGYPYVWGGEWGLATPEPSALGGQPVAGFDCSGLDVVAPACERHRVLEHRSAATVRGVEICPNARPPTWRRSASSRTSSSSPVT